MSDFASTRWIRAVWVVGLVILAIFILSPFAPWAGPEAQTPTTGIVAHVRADSKHSSVVAPRLYDTDPPSNGRVMVADFSAGTPPAKVKYSEDWGKFTWLDGLDGDNDCHLAGDFTGSRHGQVLFLESAIVVGVRSVSSSSPSHPQAARPQREAMKKDLSSLGLRIGSRAGRTSDNIQDDLAASVCRSSLTGAPFWLDTLTGVASLRLTAKKPEAPSSRSGGPSSDHA